MSAEVRGIREKLALLQKQQEAIEKEIAAVYEASLNAPSSEKVCDDFIAGMLAEPLPLFQYPIEVQGITYEKAAIAEYGSKKVGRFVAVRPANDSKTYLGIYIGDIALSSGVSFDRVSGVLTVGPRMHNPALWVPDLNRIVFGCESWWGTIKNEEDMRQISNQDIENVWYVKAMKSLAGSENSKVESPA